MQKIETVIKEDLFEALGLSIGKCSAFTEDSDSYVRINGDILCTGEWDKEFCLKVKANLCNENDEIIHVDYDFDKKTFLKIGYESFSICCYKESNNGIKYVELYPKIEKVSEGEDD